MHNAHAPTLSALLVFTSLLLAGCQNGEPEASAALNHKVQLEDEALSMGVSEEPAFEKPKTLEEVQWFLVRLGSVGSYQTTIEGCLITQSSHPTFCNEQPLGPATHVEKLTLEAMPNGKATLTATLKPSETPDFLIGTTLVYRRVVKNTSFDWICEWHTGPNFVMPQERVIQQQLNECEIK